MNLVGYQRDDEPTYVQQLWQLQEKVEGGGKVEEGRRKEEKEGKGEERGRRLDVGSQD